MKKLMKKGSKILRVVALGLVCAMILAACASSAPAPADTPPIDAEADATHEPDSGTDAVTEPDSGADVAPEPDAAGLIRVGLTFGDMANPVWADAANHMVAVAPNFGFEVTAVGADTADEQITQVENFIVAGNEAIVVGAVDTASLGSHMASVIDQGIFVFALGYEIENYSADMMVSNFRVGYATAEMAVEWIQATFGDDEVEVMIVEAPDIDVLVDRVDGFEAALEELAPNARIAARVSGTTVADVLPQAENAFMANPNIKVVLSIGDGGSLAAREAAHGMGLAADDFGIFGVDATEEVLRAIYDEDLIRGALSLGGGAFHAEVILEVLQAYFAGQDFARNTLYPEFAVTTANVVEIAAQLGANLN